MFGQCPPGADLELFGSGAGPYDQVGYDLALAGDILLVGSFEKGTGFAHVHRRNAGGAGAWGEVARLEPGVTSQVSTFFGTAVDLEGSTAIVGAAHEKPLGAVYVFERDRGGVDAWGRAAWILGSNVPPSARFGADVALSGDTLLVGVPFDAPNQSGSAIVFERVDGVWIRGPKLTAPMPTFGDLFGAVVALDGDRAVVGASGDDQQGSEAGAVYVFERDQDGPGAWGLVTKLFAPMPKPGDRFGSHVAVDDDTLAVSSTSMNQTGALFVFRNPAGGPNTWTLELSTIAKEPTPNGAFGYKVELCGDRLGTSDLEAPGPAVGDGAGYLYRRTGNQWLFEAKLVPTVGVRDHAFGGLALSADAVAAGAIISDLHAMSAGAAYVFVPDEVTNVCTAAPNSVGPGALLHPEGGISVATGGFDLVATGLPPLQTCLWLMAPDAQQVPFGDGYLCLSTAAPGILRLDVGASSDTAGRARFALQLGQLPPGYSVDAGSTRHFQLVYRDPAGGSGLNASDALRVEFCP